MPDDPLRDHPAPQPSRRGRKIATQRRDQQREYQQPPQPNLLSPDRPFAPIAPTFPNTYSNTNRSYNPPASNQLNVAGRSTTGAGPNAYHPTQAQGGNSGNPVSGNIPFSSEQFKANTSTSKKNVGSASLSSRKYASSVPSHHDAPNFQHITPRPYLPPHEVPAPPPQGPRSHPVTPGASHLNHTLPPMQYQVPGYRPIAPHPSSLNPKGGFPIPDENRRRRGGFINSISNDYRPPRGTASATRDTQSKGHPGNVALAPQGHINPKVPIPRLPPRPIETAQPSHPNPNSPMQRELPFDRIVTAKSTDYVLPQWKVQEKLFQINDTGSLRERTRKSDASTPRTKRMSVGTTRGGVKSSQAQQSSGSTSTPRKVTGASVIKPGIGVVDMSSTNEGNERASEGAKSIGNPSLTQAKVQTVHRVTGRTPYKAARKIQSLPVSSGSESDSSDESTSDSDSDVQTADSAPNVEEDPHPNLSDVYTSEDDSDEREELDESRDEGITQQQQLPAVAVPPQLADEQDDVKPNIVPHPDLLSALESFLPTPYVREKGLPFLRRVLRKGFKSRCDNLGIPTAKDRRSISLRCHYQHVAGIPDFKQSLQAWLCPVCWLHGGQGFATREMLEKHLDWDHPYLFCEWEDLGTNERVTTWRVVILIPEISEPSQPPRRPSLSVPPIETFPSLPESRQTSMAVSTLRGSVKLEYDVADLPVRRSSLTPQPSIEPILDPEPDAMDVDSPPATAPSPSDASSAPPAVSEEETSSSQTRTNTEPPRSASEASEWASATTTGASSSADATSNGVPVESSASIITIFDQGTTSSQTNSSTPRPSPSRRATPAVPGPAASASTNVSTPRSARRLRPRPRSQPRTPKSQPPDPQLHPFEIPPRSDPLGPASSRPPDLPALPDYEGGHTLYYSTRIGGVCLFDLLQTLPMEDYGILEWEVLDREEEIYEATDMCDEFKIMHALWARWIMVNQSFFISDYSRGAKAFVDKYWQFIHRAAGWDALRYWLVTLLANRFLSALDVAHTLKHYESLTNMSDWYPDANDQ